MTPISRMEMLQRVKVLVSRLRLLSGPFYAQPLQELVVLETALAAIEVELAETIDSHMAGLYRRHNQPALLLDIHGITIGRRWNKERLRKWEQEQHRLDQALLLERILPA